MDSTVEPAEVELRDGEDFGSFKVVIAGGSGGAQGIGDLDGLSFGEDGDALVSVATVRRLAGPLAADAGWERSLQGMLEYASGKGWLTSDRKGIRAHCEYEAA